MVADNFALRHRAGGMIIVLLLLVPCSAAAAAPNASAGGTEVHFFIELGILLLVGRLLGEAANRLGQPSVIGQLLGGLLLGPSVFGLLFPSAQHFLFPTEGTQKNMIDAVAQLGILMLLLLTGMETDLQLVRRVGRAAVTVAAAGVALPFVCGFALGEFIPAEFLPRPDARLVTSIFLGTALSISSVKIVAMVVREMNFMRRDLGQIIVASAILEDTMGWVIIAVALGLAANGNVDLWSVARTIGGTALFLALSFTIGRKIVFTLIRWTNDHLESDFPVITTILVIMIAMAVTTDLIGVNTVLGAFVAGILIGESPILTQHIDERLRGLIVALFMPVFFGLAGLSADLTVLKAPESRFAHRRPDCDRQPRQIPRRLCRRHDRWPHARGIAGTRLRHECARLDRSDRGDGRPVGGRAQPEPVHHHRRHGSLHDLGHAADVALVAQAPAAAPEGAPAHPARTARRQELCRQSRTPAARCRRQHQRQIRLPAGRCHCGLRRQADDNPRPVAGETKIFAETGQIEGRRFQAGNRIRSARHDDARSSSR